MKKLSKNKIILISIILLLCFATIAFAVAPKLTIIAGVDGVPPVPELNIIPDPSLSGGIFKNTLADDGKYIHFLWLSSTSDTADVYLSTSEGDDDYAYKYDSSAVYQGSQKYTPPRDTFKVELDPSGILPGNSAVVKHTHIACADNRPISGSSYSCWNTVSGSSTQSWRSGYRYVNNGGGTVVTWPIHAAALLPDGTTRSWNVYYGVIPAFNTSGAEISRSLAFGVSSAYSGVICGDYYLGTGYGVDLRSDATSIAISATTSLPTNQSLIYLYAHDGTHQLTIGGAPGSGDGSLGGAISRIALNAAEVFIADANNSRIQVFNRTTGAFKRKWGTPGSDNGQFNGLYQIDVDSNYVYTVDADNGRVQVFLHDGTYVAKITGLTQPKGIRVTSTYIYVVDGGGLNYLGYRVRRYLKYG